MSYALVFSGQGTQHADMLRWLQPGAELAAVEQALGSDWRARLADADWAQHNRHAQPLLTGLALAAWAQLQPALQGLPPPAIVCGYSVGEVAAFCAAGVYDAATALQLAQRRAACMDAADAAYTADAADAADTTIGAPTGLLALGGATPQALRELAARFDLDVAIRIGPGNAVLGGPRGRLAQAADAALAAGLQVTPLHVALASHTRWMAGAAQAFDTLLVGVPLQPPRLPLFSNALGRVRTAAQARAALSAQIAQTVAWDDCLDAIEEQQVDAVLEIGPGQALARMWLARHPEAAARSADEFGSAGALAKWLQRHAGEA